MASEPSTAIVTGAGKRVGAVLATGLLERGWVVVAHVRGEGNPVPEGAIRVAADLGHANCAEVIFAAAAALPPVRLLINNAAHFAYDALGALNSDELDQHMRINLRAPVLLSETFAAQHRGGDGLIVNLLDAKLSGTNPDFLSYTLSKQALAGFTEIAARAWASRRIRVNGIAPALMLPSGEQSAANFAKVHAHNPLARGVEPEQVASALDYLIATPTVTGEILTIDGGQRFEPPPRDVQMLEQG